MYLVRPIRRALRTLIVAPNSAYPVRGTSYQVPGTAGNPIAMMHGFDAAGLYVHRLLGTLIFPSMICCFNCSTFVRTESGISFALFASYT